MPIKSQSCTCFPTDTRRKCTRFYTNLGKKKLMTDRPIVLFRQKTISLGLEPVKYNSHYKHIDDNVIHIEPRYVDCSTEIDKKRHKKCRTSI